MSKKIAVHLSDLEETISLNECGTIKVYAKKNTQWVIEKKLDFSISEAVGIKGIRDKYVQLAEVLDDCKILVASNITGISYNVLDSMGFNLWEIEGKPDEFLEHVLESEIKNEINETKEYENGDKEIGPVEADKEGHYFIDLKRFTENNSRISTKQALLPFLRSRTFYELEIICSHMPPWFDREFAALGLKYFAVQNSTNEYKVRVYHKTCNE
jgi:Fe-only nitrogenase accessory protein AnfO